MKQTIIKCMFIASFIILGLIACNKDEQENKTEFKSYVHTSDEAYRIENKGRSGNYQPVFYLGSATSDNFTLWQKPRTQISYNKSVIDSIYFNQYDTEVVNISGVNYSFYDVMVKYFDGTIIKGQFMCPVSIGIKYQYRPLGAPLFSYLHRYITFEKTLFKTIYFDSNFGIQKNKWRYIIGINQDTVGTDYINGTMPTGSTYLLKHQ